MRKIIFGLTAFMSLSLTTSYIASAQDSDIDPDLLVADVDGQPIYFADIQLLYDAYASQLQGAPIEQFYTQLLDIAIKTEVLAQKAVEEKLDEGETFEMRMRFLRDSVLEQEYVNFVFSQPLDENNIIAVYNDYVNAFESQQEANARHILVEDEQQALDIISRLDDGEDFASLASEFSIDRGSAAVGGSLGYFGLGFMVAPFETAAFEQDIGVHSATPVESRYGYHIILVEDRRETQPESIETMRADIEQGLYNDMINQVLTDSETVIERSPSPFESDTDVTSE